LTLAACPSAQAQGTSAESKPTPTADQPTGSVSQPAPVKHQLQSTSYRNFHRDLWHNFGGLFARDNAIPAAIGLGAAAIVAPKDDEIAGYFLRRERFAPAARIGSGERSGILSSWRLAKAGFSSSAR
jgi:hypothetical protein